MLLFFWASSVENVPRIIGMIGGQLRLMNELSRSLHFFLLIFPLLFVSEGPDDRISKLPALWKVQGKVLTLTRSSTPLFNPWTPAITAPEPLGIFS